MKYFSPVRSGKSFALWACLLALPLLFCLPDNGKSPFLLWGMLLSLYFVPCALLAACHSAGLGCSLLGIVFSSAAWYIIAGAGGAAAYGAAVLVPLTVYCYVSEKDIPFVKAVPATVLAYAAEALILTGALAAASPNGDLFTFAADSAVNAVRSMGAEGDILLYTFSALGLIGDGSRVMNAEELLRVFEKGFSEAEREALLTGDYSVRVLAANYILILLPAYIGGHSIYAGVLGPILAQHNGRKRRERCLKTKNDQPLPSMGMPRLRSCFIPRRWGAAFGILAVGYLFQMVSSAPMMVFCGTLFTSVFSAVYTLQGAALLNDRHHARGTAPVWRKAVPVLLAAFLPFVLILFGVMDQIKDIRGLRAPENEKGELEI